MRSKILIPLIIAITIASCREIYNPDIITSSRILVVNALITDQNKSHTVSLSWSLPYDSDDQFTPATDANVSVTDELGNTFFFNEVSDGLYKSDSILFKGVAGVAYTLHIEKDDDIYESKPQIMTKVDYSSSIYGLVNKEDILESIGNITRVKTINMAKIYLDIKGTGTSLPRFRFDVFHIIESIYDEIDTTSTDTTGEVGLPEVKKKMNNGTMEADPSRPVITHFCWRTLYPVDQISITSEVSMQNESVFDLNQQLVGSFPIENMIMARDTVNIDTIWYEEEILGFVTAIVDTTPSIIYKRILVINSHQITEDAYQFYKGVANQANSDGKIFDPLPAQIKGNIQCINNPGKPVFGVFEVSTVKTTEYIYLPHVPSGTVSFETGEIQIPDPDVGNVTDFPPHFWIY